MKSILALRRALTAAGLVVFSLVAVPSALATHLRGGTLSWVVTSTTATTYTVQFTLTESQRWSYPNSPENLCTGPVPSSTTYCVAAGTTVMLGVYIGPGNFYFGDGTSVGQDGTLGDIPGTVTSINQAQDYATAVFVFSHTYTGTAATFKAYLLANERIDTLKLGGDQPEYISTIVSNSAYGSPVASEPAILSVPLQNTATFNVAAAVSDTDPNVNLVYRLSTIDEIYGPSGPSVLYCATNVAYEPGGVASGNPPGFSISSAGLVTWDETQIPLALNGTGNCKFPMPATGDLWSAQVMVETYDKTTNALITKVPIDLLLQFVETVGAAPTIMLNPAGPQTVNPGTAVSFTATGNSANSGAVVTLNASGVPSGATASGLNATVTPPATSSFSWTPTAAQTGNYVVTYTVTDGNLQQAVASETIVVDNLPTIACSAGITPMYRSNGTVSATVNDPTGQNEPLTVVWTVDGTAVQTDPNLSAYPNPFTDSLGYTSGYNFGAVGPHTVTATATDSHGGTVSCSPSVTVVPANQTITFSTPTSVTYGAPDFALTATATSQLPVSYTPAGSCTVLGTNIVHLTGVGTCQITAMQAGNSNYNAAPNVKQSFNINPDAVSTMTSTLTANPSPAVAGSTVTVTATIADTAGNPINGATASFSSTSGTVSFGAVNVTGNVITTTVTDTVAENAPISVTLGGNASGMLTGSATFVAPAYIVTVNTDEASGNGVASNCVDTNLPTYTVAANANCGLRDAVAAANALRGVTTNIGFSGSAVGTAGSPAVILIQQTGGITISQNVILMGPGANLLTLEGGTTPLSSSNNQILQVNNSTVSISGLTFANGYTAGSGGAIETYGNNGGGALTLSNSVFTGNEATNGGAVQSSGAVTVSNSTFSGNQASQAGGAIDATSLTVSNSTFSGNQAASAGAIEIGNTGTIANSTFSGNQAANLGGAIYASGPVTVTNSIFSGDPAPNGSVHFASGSSLTNIVYNGDTFNGVTPTSSINADPKLSPLGNYGGSTPTLLPLPGSAAICAGTQPMLNGNAIATDQRGNNIMGARYGQSACYDVGAVQTSYALTLGPSPVVPSIVTLGSPISPAVVATVTESGSALTAGPATVAMTDADSDFAPTATLSATTSMSNGQASFGNLLFNAAEPTDTLTAILALNANLPTTISLSAASNSFQVGKLTPAITAFPPSSITYGTPSVNLTGLLSWTGPVMPTGAVTFLIDSTIPVPATCTSSGNCSATYNGAATLFGGPHTLTASIAPDALYNTATSAPVPFSVSRATPTFMVAPATITYGTAAVILTATVNVTGPANLTGGVSINVDSGPQFETSCALTGPHHLSCTANVPLGGLSVGSHTITASDSGDTNYISTSGTGTLTVNPAMLAVAIVGNPTKVYDGTTTAMLTSANYQVSGVVSPDVITVTQPTGAYISANAGSQAVTALLTASSFTAATGSLSNYNLTTMAIGPGTITQASSTTKVTCPPSVTYNGQPQMPCSATVTGAGGLNQAVTPVMYSSNVNAGTNTATAMATFVGDQNHTQSSGSASFTILPALLTLTAGNFTGVYDGTAATIPACVATPNPDGITCSNNPATVGPDVGSGTVTPVPSGPTGNYNVASASGSWKITPRTVTLTAGSYSHTYDGSAHAPTGCASNYAGVTCTNSPASVGPGVGSGAVNPVPSYGTGVQADYTVTSVAGAYSITPAAVTATAGTGNTVYDGSTHSPSACMVTGVYTGDLSCTNSPATVGPDVINTSIAPMVTGSNLSNFTITKVNGSYTINQATSVTTVSCPASVTYTGAAQTPCTASATGVGGLSVNLTSSLSYSSNIHAGVNTASAMASYGGDLDHSGSSGSKTFTINKATPVITWPTPASFTYGTPLSTTQLDATANVPGTFLYTAEGGLINPYGVLLPPGTTALSATLTPTDSADYNSVTAYVVFTVSKAQTTTTLAVTTTQTVTGTTATITATVHPQIGGVPTGTVMYYDGSTVLGSAAVGTPFTTGVLPVGSNSITAVYGGDTNFVGSSSSATVVTSVAPTTVQLIEPLGTVFYPASAVGFTVIVPLKNLQLISGTITLYDGATVIGTYSLPLGGVLAGVTPQLSVGTHSLRAVYGGNAQYPPGESPIVTVVVARL